MQLRHLSIALAAAGLLSACGGGSDDSAAPAPAPAPAPASPSVTITGVAATGAAMANAAVSVSCASGSGSATAAASGAYTVTVAEGALPCVLTATSGGTTLHSVAAGSGSTATANITPLTELLVAQLSGQSPASFVATADAATLSATLTPSALGAAQSAVIATLSAAGLDTAAIGDFVGGTLTAATSTSSGNAYDQALDALATTLAGAGSSLTALTTTVAATATATASGGDGSSSSADSGTETLALPANLLLKSKAANCAALASGSYQVIKAAPSVSSGAADTVTALESFTLDAAALKLTSSADSNDTWSWTANGNCRFSTADGTDIVVSPAGVVVARAAIGGDDDTVGAAARGSYRLALALPVQTIAVAELAGTWNYLSWSGTGGGTYAVEGATFTLGSDGKVSAVSCDADTLATAATGCATTTTLLPTFSANEGGGYTVTSTDPQDAWRSRAFAYRAGSGELMLVMLDPDGSLTFATRQRTLALPAVGDANTVWNLFAGAGGIADAVGTTTNTVTTLDTTGVSYGRNSSSNGSSVTVPQTIALNNARNGYSHRAAAAVTASDGSAASVREAYFLKLKGFGLTAVYLPATGANSNARFGLSVRQP